jgi:hypothetical protein
MMFGDLEEGEAVYDMRLSRVQISSAERDKLQQSLI